MKIAAFSDTHTYHDGLNVPDADVLIFAGDLMSSGYTRAEVIDFAEWFSSFPHKYKILVAGNHDRLFESNQKWCTSQFHESVIYLRDQEITIDGFKFYGSPVQPWFCNWAFNVPRGAAIKEYWDRIPLDTDVLITHGPPYGVLDKMGPVGSKLYDSYDHLGCEELAKRVAIVKPKVHIFGHIHGGSGADFDPEFNTLFVNVAICDEAYKPVNLCVTVELA